MDKAEQYIPIKNLYYIFCYAWGLAEQREKLKVDAESCTTYPDLFAKLLVAGCSLLFKRGLHHEYVAIDESILGIKGKWNISESIKSNDYRIGRMDCTFDEYSDDILVNQIIYASLRRLLGYKGLNRKVKKDVLQIYHRFPQMSDLDLSAEVFQSVVITRDNRFYSLLIHICQLIYEALLPNENEEGTFHFVEFSQEHMERVFENFLFNFYKKECHNEYPIVERSKIRYNLHTIEGSASVLPIMITDVTLINPKEQKKIILDAKYYMDTLVAKFAESTHIKMRTQHMNQILSYIHNQEDISIPYTMNANGILLYPKVDVDLNYTGLEPGTNHHFRFCTVDLNKEWWEIDKRLKEIINFNI